MQTAKSVAKFSTFSTWFFPLRSSRGYEFLILLGQKYLQISAFECKLILYPSGTNIANDMKKVRQKNAKSFTRANGKKSKGAYQQRCLL